MSESPMTRRHFIKLVAMGAAGLAAASCKNLVGSDPQTVKLRVEFSEPMNKTSVEDAIRLQAGAEFPPLDSVWESDAVATFDFGVLDSQSVEGLIIYEGATDLAGNALGFFEYAC